MRKTSFALVLSVAVLACFPAYSQQIKEEAQILYEEAMGMQKKGNKAKAVEMFEKALRKDRAVLALDDNGLIEELKKHTEKKLKDNPDNLKLLETMGFIHAVCYSDNATAIKYYEQVVEKVNDNTVKGKTLALIERLRASQTVNGDYQEEMSSSRRDERLRSWSQMEKNDKLAEERAAKEDIAAKLEKAYQNKEELENRVPQLEDELNELQESYDKANRLWYATHDEMYERRRRRFKNDIADKKAELDSAKASLSKAESTASRLEAKNEELNGSDEGGETEEGGEYEGEEGVEGTEGTEGTEETEEGSSEEGSEEHHGYGLEGSEESEGSSETEESSFPGDGASYEDSESGENTESSSGNQLDDLIDSL